MPELVGAPQPDLVLVNDDDLTYAKVRLDERSLATLTELDRRASPSTLPRALCWSAAWDMTRDAEMSTQRLRDPGARAASAARPTARSCAPCCGRPRRPSILYADPAQRRDGAGGGWPTACSRCCARPTPGSDSQLQLARAFASAAVTDEQLAIVRGLLDGTEQLDGLTIDTDLRWHLLHRLVAAGKADERRDRPRARRRRHGDRAPAGRGGPRRPAGRRGEGRGLGGGRRAATSCRTRSRPR